LQINTTFSFHRKSFTWEVLDFHILPVNREEDKSEEQRLMSMHSCTLEETNLYCAIFAPSFCCLLEKTNCCFLDDYCFIT